MLQTSLPSVQHKTTFLLNALAASMLLTQHVHAAAPAPGVQITNIAYASFISSSNEARNIQSNQVAVDVALLYAVDLSAAPQQIIEPGDQVRWLNTLTNLSNEKANIDLKTSFDSQYLSNIKVYWDTDRDGLISATDLEIAAPIELKAGEQIQLIVRADSSANLTHNQVTDVTLNAIVVEDQNAKDTVVDSLIAIVPELVAVKSVDKSSVDPAAGQEIQLNYQLRVENKSSNPARLVDVKIDGRAQQALIVKDALPPNTTYVKASARNSKAQVVFAVGSSTTEFTTTAPAPELVNDVYVAYLQEIPANTTEIVDLTVQVNNGVTNTLLANRFEVQFLAPTGKVTTKISNDAATQVLGSQEIQIKDPNFNDIAATGSAGRPLYIEVDAAACNFSRTVANKVWIEITSPTTNDKERLVAEETGSNTGRYRTTLPTQATVNAIVGDKILQTLGGDNVGVVLTDCVETNSPNDTSIPIPPSQRVNTTVLMDPVGLSLNKIAGVTTAEIGDFVDYTIEVSNTGTSAAPDVTMVDKLPRGFVYVTGSMRVDGQAFVDPQGEKGPYLKLGLGAIAPTAKKKVQYRVYIGPNALNGDGINRAVATDISGKTSNEDTAKVKVSPGVLMSDGFVIGKVYTDCNRNGMQDTGERGVPGIRLYMEDGSFVVTDSEGKYDFYGVKPQTHVLKLDRSTLPYGAVLVEQSNRNAGDPGSRFVDLKRGELHRADFAMVDSSNGCTTNLDEQITERRKLIGDQNADLERVLRSELAIEPNYTLGEVRSLPASGCITANGASADCNLKVPTNQQAPTYTAPIKLNKVVAPKLLDLEQEMKQSDSNRLTVLNLQDGQVLPYPQTNVQIKAVAGTRIEVLVNGEEVGESRVGKRAVLADRQMAGYDYIGLNLKEGRNTIEVRQYDGMGNLRDQRQLDVLAPGNMNSLSLKLDQNAVEANGRDSVNMIVRVVDANGTLVASRTPVTIDSTIGKIQLEDLDPNQAGVQQFIEGGELHIPLLSPTQAGEGRLVISSGVFQAQQDIRFVPELRPMIAAGIIEGAISLTDFDPKSLSKASKDDGFEAELNELATGKDGKLQTTGRAAFFLKGKVKGEYLLTMAYDSNKDKDQRLFRDIRPDEYYPVYGDAAAKGFDAQSTSKFYVRLDKGRSYALYGDYTTRIDNDEGLSLGQYNRSLTGVRAHHEDGKHNLTTFAAQTTSRQIVTEQRGLGISGPYSLGDVAFDTIIENSEKVELLVRDRNNPGLILRDKSRTLTRFVDYDVDTLSGAVYLKRPITSEDENGNPQSLRITVESEQGGESYIVAGVAGKTKLTDRVSVGGSYVKSDDPLTKEELASVNAVAKLSDRTKLIAEVARSENTVDPLNRLNSPNASMSPTGEQSGVAGRVELNYATANSETRVYHSQAEEGFYNVASPISAGRKESGVRIQARLPQVGLAKVEAIRTEDMGTAGVRDGVVATIERALNQYINLEVGARYYEETSSAASATSTLANTPYKGTTARAKLNAQLPWLEGASTFAEYEQDIEEADRKVFALGGSYQLGNRGRVYARHELMSSISGTYGLNDATKRNSTVVGIDGNYMKDGTVFSEYRMRDGISAREAEAALGLRNQWHVSEGIRLNTSFEKIQSLKGANDSQDATAISIGAEYLTDPLWKAVGKVEKRWAKTADTFINTLGAAYKASDDVTLLVKNVYNLTDNKTTGDRTIDRFQVGAAYRDFDNTTLDGLAKLEYRLDDNQSLAEPVKREVYIASAHANYHPVRRLTLASQYAAKYVRQDQNSLENSGATQLVSARVIYDLNERWDVSVQTGVMWSNVSDGQRHLIGAEVGYLLAANLWVSGGYNFIGYRDDDLLDSNTTAKGGYIRLRFKFDEDLLNMGSAAVNKSMEPQQ